MQRIMIFILAAMLGSVSLLCTRDFQPLAPQPAVRALTASETQIVKSSGTFGFELFNLALRIVILGQAFSAAESAFRCAFVACGAKRFQAEPATSGSLDSIVYETVTFHLPHLQVTISL